MLGEMVASTEERQEQPQDQNENHASRARVEDSPGARSQQIDEPVDERHEEQEPRRESPELAADVLGPFQEVVEPVDRNLRVIRVRERKAEVARPERGQAHADYREDHHRQG